MVVRNLYLRAHVIALEFRESIADCTDQVQCRFYITGVRLRRELTHNRPAEPISLVAWERDLSPPIERHCSGAGIENYLKTRSNRFKNDGAVRLHRRWGGVGRMCDGQPFERGSGGTGASSGSGAGRQESVRSHSGRFLRCPQQPGPALALRERAGAPTQRPAHVAAARQVARRLVVDQRDGVRPWSCARLRQLGDDGGQRLVVRRSSAVFPQVRDL